MNRPSSSFALVLCIVFITGCASHHISSSSSRETSAMEFERLYSAWHHDIETEGDGSDNATMQIGRPSFRDIIAMGKPALPFLEQKLEDNKGEDCLLAFAVVEICGWDRHDFVGFGAQEFRANVLRRMQASGMTPNKSLQPTATAPAS